MGPGLYSAFGQKARDLLFKDYHSDKKITATSPCSLKGPAATWSFTQKGEGFEADIATQLKNKNITADIKAYTNPNLNLFTTITVNEPAPGVKAILSFKAHEQTSGIVELQYLHDYVGICGNIGLKAHPDANLSLAIGTDVLAFGTDFSFDAELFQRQLNCEVTKANVGMSYVKDNLTGALTLNLIHNALNASFYQVINPLTNTAVGVEINHQFIAKKNTFTIGAQHTFDPLTMAKARISDSGMASALIQHRWCPKSFFTISGEVDTKDINKGVKVGLSLVVD